MAKQMTIKAHIGKDGPEHSATIEFGENLDELVEQFSEEVVYNQAKAALVVSLQGFMRSKVNGKEPVTGKALQDAVDAWKPGTRQPGVAKVEKLKERINKMSPEEKAALMAQLAAGDEEEEKPAQKKAAAGKKR